MTKHPIVVLISGNGTNLQALIDATASSRLPNATIVRVISNRKSAFGLTRAAEAKIPTTYHNLVSYKSKEPDSEAGVTAAREAYDQDLARMIVSNEPKPHLVVCAGWMHILSSSFVDTLQQNNVAIINLHPAMPGKFDGANAISRAWNAFQRGEIVSTGVMVHYVISEVDAGKPIVVKEVECIPHELESGLEERIHKVEWELIIEGTAVALKDFEEAGHAPSGDWDRPEHVDLMA